MHGVVQLVLSNTYEQKWNIIAIHLRAVVSYTKKSVLSQFAIQKYKRFYRTQP